MAAELSVEISADEVAATTIAVVRARVPIAKISERFGPLLDQVWAVINAGKLEKYGHNVFVYRAVSEGDGTEVDVEFGVQVVDRFADLGEVVCSQTPAGRVAHAVAYGPSEKLQTAHGALIAWCNEKGLERTSVNWEVYGDWEEDPAKRRTDVFHLLAD